jgi:hypothetical protein
MQITEEAAGPFVPYMLGLGLRLLVRWVGWCVKTKLKWWQYWKWLAYDFKAIVTLLVVGAGCAAAWTTGILVTAVQDYIPVSLDGLPVTFSMSVMVGFLFSLLVCRRLKLEGI